MFKVYACPNCKAIGKSYVSSCPKCRGTKILEIPFDGKWVTVHDADLRRVLQQKYEEYERRREFTKEF